MAKLFGKEPNVNLKESEGPTFVSSIFVTFIWRFWFLATFRTYFFVQCHKKHRVFAT